MQTKTINIKVHVRYCHFASTICLSSLWTFYIYLFAKMIGLFWTCACICRYIYKELGRSWTLNKNQSISHQCHEYSCHDKADRLITLIWTTYNHPHMYHSKAEYVREHQILVVCLNNPKTKKEESISCSKWTIGSIITEF
jgi:hypothetical protein